MVVFPDVGADSPTLAPNNNQTGVFSVVHKVALDDTEGENPSIPTGFVARLAGRRVDDAGVEVDDGAGGAIGTAAPAGEIEVTGEVWGFFGGIGEIGFEEAFGGGAEEDWGVGSVPGFCGGVVVELGLRRLGEGGGDEEE